MTPRRIHVIGAPGSGKSTLADRLHLVTDLPVHGLDDIARIGGGNGPFRPVAERDALVAAIAAEEAWITEGVHLGWTDPLLARADAVVWLDHVSPVQASGRMVRRFLSGGVQGLRDRNGRERFTRLGDYLRHTRELGGAIRASRNAAADAAAFEAALAPYRGKTVRCTSAAEVDDLVRSMGRP